MDPVSAALAIAAVAGLGAALSAAQDLAAAREFSDTGLLSWPVTATAGSRLSTRVRSLVMPASRYRWVLWVKLLAGALAPVAALTARPAATVLALALAVTAVLTVQRSAYGLDGSDQMSVLALVTAAGALLAGPDSTASRVLLVFLAAQLVLSYLVAGVTKLVSPQWRSGTGLAGVFGTAEYGSAGLHAFTTRHPGLVRLAAHGTIAFECTFWVALFAPTPVLLAYLAMGLAFHLSVAVTMGLTTFVFAFPAAYPAVFWLHAVVP